MQDKILYFVQQQLLVIMVFILSFQIYFLSLKLFSDDVRKGIWFWKEMGWVIIFCIDIYLYTSYLRLHYIYDVSYPDTIWIGQLIICVIFLILSFKKYTGKAVKDVKKLDESSIKEALDEFPDGIMWADINGRPILINREMYRLNYRILGRYIPDINAMWKSWRAKSEKDLAIGEKFYVNTENTLYLKFGEKEIWRLQRQEMSIDKLSYYKVLATDITALYQENHRIKEAIELHKEQKVRLQNLFKELDETNSKKDYLRFKINMHRDYGDCLQATRLYLRDSNSIGFEELRRIWKRMISGVHGIKERDFEKEKEEIERISRVLGCVINFPDDRLIPRKYLAFYYSCVREALDNAVRHSAATAMDINQKKINNITQVVISDNGKGIGEAYREGGGLSGLRAMAEKLDIGFDAFLSEGRVNIKLEFKQND